MKGSYFEGWYFKCQGENSLALIPAHHGSKTGRPGASLQVITRGQSWWLDYPEQELQFRRRPLYMRLGESCFSEYGLDLNVEREGLSLHGSLNFGALTPLSSDIMGFFRFFPMECRHEVFSMKHPVAGTLTLNGAELTFSAGYLEGDSGRSFPKRYLWSQCLWDRGSIMLAVATIPPGFTGCLCAVLHGGREYRLGTYRGGRAVRWSEKGAELRQGKLRLRMDVLEQHPQPLHAPAAGVMGRVVRESLCATVRYRFWVGGELLFDHTDPCASFEFSALH